jgi:hypothetical protein
MTRLVASSLLILSLSHSAYANINEYFKYPISPSSSNMGNTGILETPNAKFMKPGSLRVSFSSSFPYEYTSFNATPFSWMEANYRYAEIKNEKYGPSAYSGNQSLKDKGFDLKIRLFKESSFFPAIATGLRDIAGTGLFASEYIVATKSFKDLDLSVGMGWGLLGRANNISNPLASLEDKFETRNSYEGEGGEFSSGNWFSGDTAIFGGAEYHLRKLGLTIKLEYDTSEYDKDSNNPLLVDSRLNYGLLFNYSKNLNLGIAYERGNTFRASFNIKGNFFEDTIKKPSPKNVISLSKEQQERSFKNKNLFYTSLNNSLKDESIYIQAATYKDKEIDVAIASPKFKSFTRIAGRTMRITSALASDDVERINVHNMNGDLEIFKISFDRKEFIQSDLKEGSASEVLAKSSIVSNSKIPLYETAAFQPSVNFPEFTWNMSPGLKHQIGGPEGFYLGQLFWSTNTIVKFKRNLSLYTSFGINIYDTFKDFNNPSSSQLPHVRSDIQDYLKEGKNNIQRMKLEYMFSPYKDIFIKADMGLLEEMFAGVGGEILYRPFKRNYALGLNLYRVRQRGYEQLFKLRKYETNTGHLGFYTSVKDVNIQLQIGKYLAGDTGFTLDLGKRFSTGFTLGVFATKTNVPKEIFGEGSFDKGFYFSIPTSLFYSDFRTGNISFGLQPLTKDGGAMLSGHNGLWGILGDTNKKAVLNDWNEILR